MTPADFALGEVRFKKQFRAHPRARRTRPPSRSTRSSTSPTAERRDHVPFVWATDADKQLIKVVASDDDRGPGRGPAPLLADPAVPRRRPPGQAHRPAREDVAELQARYDEAQQQRETSLDDIARAMSELATSSSAQRSRRPCSAARPPATAGAPAPPRPPRTAAPAAGPTLPVVTLDRGGQLLCNDCKTCYQDLPQLFEKTKIVVHGEARDVARLIPGALDEVGDHPGVPRADPPRGRQLRRGDHP